jgi:hypothetical protein
MTKLISISQAAAVLLFCAGLPAGAQDAAAPDDSAVGELYSPDALDQLLRPIALYPDPLLAEIFTAATLPAQIVLADRYVDSGGDLNRVAAQPWDPSVQGLTHYPTVLKWLDDNLPWTTEVGQAFLNQQQEVMDSIQRLRLLAQGQGNLPSTTQENVVTDDGTVEIEPANSDFIYVPLYPWNTIYYDPGIYCTFGVGFPIGLWLGYDWDWRNHHVIAWGPGHPRPVNWWSQPPRNRVAPRGVAVWHPPGRASAGVAGGADRGFAPQAFWPVRSTPSSSPAPVGASRPAVSTGGSRPGTVPGFSTGISHGGAPPSAGRAPIPTSSPPPISHSFSGFGGSSGGVSSSFGGGAFGGSESSSQARESSARGFESRSTMSAPAPAPSAPERSSAPSSPERSSAPSSQSSGSSGKR